MRLMLCLYNDYIMVCDYYESIVKHKFDTFRQMDYQKISISDSEINNNSFKNETSLLSVEQLEQQLNLIIEHLDPKENVDTDEEVLSNFDSDCESFTIDKQYGEEFSDGESGKKDLEELLHDAQKIPNHFLQFDPEDIELIGKDYRLKYQETTEQNQTTSQNSFNRAITEDLRNILKLDPELKNYRKFSYCSCCHEKRLQYVKYRMKRQLSRKKRLERLSYT